MQQLRARAATPVQQARHIIARAVFGFQGQARLPWTAQTPLAPLLKRLEWDPARSLLGPGAEGWRCEARCRARQQQQERPGAEGRREAHASGGRQDWQFYDCSWAIPWVR
jgi:hypothetical protein